MSINPTDRFPKLTGVIVAGGDNSPDPKKLGRVKVFFPQINGADFDPEKAPWVQTKSAPNHSGINSFDRPPQEGTIVDCSKITDSGHCSVDAVVNAKYNPSDVSTNYNLTLLPWFEKARSTVPLFASGDANVTQKKETNPRNGKEKVTAADIPEKKAPSIKERDGTETTGAAVTFVRPYTEITKVGTALQKAAEAMTPEIASMLPGTPFNFANMMNSMPPALKAELTKSIPKEAMTALNNTLGLMGSYTPVTGTNFANLGQNINPDKFYPETVKKLKKIKTIDDIDSVLGEILSDEDAFGLANSAPVILKIQGPHGNTNMQVYANGSFVQEPNPIVEIAAKAFQTFVGTITSANTSKPFLANSEIQSAMIYRLPVEVQKGLKDALQNKGQGIQKTLNDAAQAFFTAASDSGSGGSSGGSSITIPLEGSSGGGMITANSVQMANNITNGLVANNTFWYDPDTNTLKIYYNDGDSVQWVEV